MNRLHLICLMLLACCPSASSQYRVAVVGSSTAGGTGAWPLDSSWVNRFNQYYKHKLQIVDSTYTLAVGGYPVYKGMPSSYVPPPDRDGPDHNRNVTRANACLAGLPLPYNGIVFINYPSNKYEEYSIAEIMICLQTIYDSVLKEGHRCYIITTQPRSGGIWDNPALKRKLAVIKDSIINRFGTQSINFYDGLHNPADSTILTKFHSGDGIHFNNEGHRELFERVRAKNVFNIVLPVKLQYFKGEYGNDKISLQWTAECTNPNTTFIIQRSEDGKSYNNLGELKATSTQASVYRYLDSTHLAGKNFYRLQIQESAQPIYSNILLIRNAKPGLALNKLYPNPANQPMLVAELSAAQHYSGTVSIHSISGLSFMSRETNFRKGGMQLWLPVEHLPGGQYILSIRYGDGQSILRCFSK
ncbi:SGNH/GDSL hydrolase family protein [Pseudoflavitalea rhizosphaerae]|uniref:SGNH/GDSL hydrolase family protein n=1 Tax=Pseudoflavitalea rhizosphaerae TaxID=1884793 RepID=UPI000F8D8436|nr:SGNH/GDSL hydrolase family protein [Pseudoflavitalea rhizosphaerae]